MTLGSNGGAGLSQIAINAGIAGDSTLIAGVPNTKIRVSKLFFVVGQGNADLIFKDGPNNMTGVMEFLRRGLLVLDYDGEPWFVTSEGNSFVLNVTPARQISGTLGYTQF